MSNLSPNGTAVIYEAQLALQRLKETGASWIIYLNKMPLTPEDRLLISEVFGRGSVVIKSKGDAQPAEWIEGRIPGVWFGVYYDSKGGPLLETLEVTLYPGYAAAQPEDLEQGLEALKIRIQDMKEAI